MEPLDKLEIIIKAEIKERKAELERSGERHSALYLEALHHEIDCLGWVWTKIDNIRRNVPAVSDEMIKRMYGRQYSTRRA